MALCKFCFKEDCPSPEDHQVQYLNEVRLTFWPENDDDESFLLIQSRAGLTKLVRNLSTEEKIVRARLLMDIATNLLTIVYGEKNRDEIQLRAKVEGEKKQAIAKKVHTRDTDLVKKAELTRAQEEIKKSGQKLSEDGACLTCKAPSIAKFCSETCEGEYKALRNFLKLGMTVENAREALKGMM